MVDQGFLCGWCNRWYSTEDLDGMDEDGQPICGGCAEDVYGQGEFGEVT